MKKFGSIHQDATLLKKVLLEEADKTEQRELEKRLAENKNLQEVYEQLQKSDALKDAFANYKHYSSEKAYQHFLEEIQHGETLKRSKVRKLVAWCSSAAAVVALAVGASFYAIHSTETTVPADQATALIYPGSSQATLTLPDGKVIDVNKEDVSVEQDGVRVNYKKGVLSYTPIKNTKQGDVSAEFTLKMSQLVIPNGGENTVILSDGTTVHLNSGSKLTYPTQFAGDLRRVSLEGEAYFEVQKDEQHPFVVHTSFGEVTVLGTVFNVNAYKNASACYTTLVNGKVRFETEGDQPVILSPGEQAVASSRGIVKREVDLDEYIGWVKGEYVFNDRTLGEIMSTFERWYNVRVYYESPALKGLMYSGSLERKNTINTFLDALEMTGDIYYKINGRSILIYKNESY